MRQATGTGPLKQIRALSQLISTPGIGVGRTVCIAYASGYHDVFTGDCYVKGVKRKAMHPRELLEGARRR